MLRPSVQPSSPSAFVNAANPACVWLSPSVFPNRIPIRRTRSPCCARAAIGHAAAALPTKEMKSRRLMWPLKSRSQTYHIVGEAKLRCASQQNRVVEVRLGSQPERLTASKSRPQHLSNRNPAHPPTLTLCARVGLFDHLVGAGEHRRGHIEAERLSGFQIDN